MSERRSPPILRTLLSIIGARRRRAGEFPGAGPDTRMSDSLERELVEREIRRQRGVW
jgi:hypothetical protein